MTSPEIMFTTVTWLRPWWLLALVPLLVAALFRWWSARRSTAGWNAVIDPQLQAYVLEGEQHACKGCSYVLFGIWSLVVVVLAGPVFEQQQLPVSEARRAEVVLFDLSRSMNTDDIPPSRLERARFKLADILERAGDDRIGLIAFAERPYVISPLTDDVETLRAFIPSLEPALMPVQGSRMDLAIDKALELLTGAGVSQGHLLLITDSSPDGGSIDAARRARSAGHAVSVLAVGTAAGTPLRDAGGGFVNDERGQIVIPAVDFDGLDALADAGAGVMQQISNNDTDIDRLQLVRQSVAVQDGKIRGSPTRSASQQWVERGPWLVPVFALLALLLFRRGAIG